MAAVALTAVRPEHQESRPPALELKNVSVSFGALAVLSDINFSIRPGERIAMLGVNGAGKTTLLNLINGDLHSDKGKILFGGTDITGLSPYRRARLGLRRTYQISLLFPRLSVFDNLYLACRGVATGRMSFLRPQKDDDAAKESWRILHAISMENNSGKFVGELSHGEQRQLEIGMALVCAPHLILFDEPAAGLSPGERNMLVEILSGLPENIGYILIEHDLDVALRVVSKVAVLHGGRILKTGNPDEIEQDREIQEIYLGNIHDSE